MFTAKKVAASSLMALFLSGCGQSIRQIDVMPPEWKANPERTAIVATINHSTVIVTKKGNDRIFKNILENLHLGLATVEHYDLYWVTPLSK